MIFMDSLSGMCELADHLIARLSAELLQGVHGNNNNNLVGTEHHISISH